MTPGTLSKNQAEAFNRFHGEFLARLVGHLVHQGASVDVATDLVQDTMIKVYQRWHEIKRPKPWAYRVAYQSYVRHATRAVEDPVADIPEPTPLLPRPGEAEAWVQEQKVVRVLRALPERQRQVLALAFDGWTPTETAKLLGIKRTAVRSSLRKARVAPDEFWDDGEEEA